MHQTGAIFVTNLVTITYTFVIKLNIKFKIMTINVINRLNSLPFSILRLLQFPR